LRKSKLPKIKKYFKNEHIKNIHKKWWWKNQKTFRDINELNSKKSIYILFATSKKSTNDKRKIYSFSLNTHTKKFIEQK